LPANDNKAVEKKGEKKREREKKKREQKKGTKKEKKRKDKDRIQHLTLLSNPHNRTARTPAFLATKGMARLHLVK
jgi:hypothetical protein